MTTPVDVNISGWTVQATSPIYDGNYTASTRPVASNAIYVDLTLGADITNGTYSIANRNGTGSDGNAYNTVQAAVTASAVGETIYLRTGTYTETGITIPNTHRGTAWTAGNYYHMRSYPGEWAVFSSAVDDATFTHAAGFGAYEKRSYTNQTQYWKFSNFEVTGTSAAFWFSGGPIWWSHLYMHDITSQTIDLSGAIWVTMPRDCIIEYCWFKDNNQNNPASNQQFGHVVFGADYRDDELPTTFDDTQCTKGNTIQYNHFDGSLWAIHYKNQQRFGIDTRVPATVASSYGDYGDLIHHNFVQNCTHFGIMVDQDNAQIYNNIIDQRTLGSTFGGVQFGLEIQASSASPTLYNGCMYNNTVLGGGKGVGVFSGVDPSTNTTLYAWVDNNIVTETESGYFEYPFVYAGDVTSGFSTTLTSMYMRNNLSHDKTGTYDIYVGYNNDYTITTAEAAHSTFTNNDSSTTAGLFNGTTGVDQYLTNSSFTFNGTTLGVGGVGASHPYLGGVTLPSYVGAVNPDDYAWVTGVFITLPSVSWLTAQTTDPTWVEG